MLEIRPASKILIIQAKIRKQFYSEIKAELSIDVLSFLNLLTNCSLNADGLYTKLIRSL
jgi:hypothetical protein